MERVWVYRDSDREKRRKDAEVSGEALFFFFHLTVTVQPVHGRYSKGRQRGKAMAGFRTVP